MSTYPPVTEVSICNRALQKLGAKTITSLTQGSPNANSCLLAYPVIRDAELAAHPWNFAISRAELAAIAPAPSWGYANAFQLPTDFLMLMPNDPDRGMYSTDWVTEGNQLLSNYDAPIQIRYIARVTDTSLFNPLFSEALASRLALELCEQITQSNTKIQTVMAMYKATLAEARRVNAIRKLPQESELDTWITVRT